MGGFISKITGGGGGGLGAVLNPGQALMDKYGEKAYGTLKNIHESPIYRYMPLAIGAVDPVGGLSLLSTRREAWSGLGLSGDTRERMIPWASGIGGAVGGYFGMPWLGAAIGASASAEEDQDYEDMLRAVKIGGITGAAGYGASSLGSLGSGSFSSAAPTTAGTSSTTAGGTGAIPSASSLGYENAFMSGNAGLGSGVETLGGYGTVGATGGSVAGVTAPTSAGLGASYGGALAAPTFQAGTIPSASSLQTTPSMEYGGYGGLESVGSDVPAAQSLGYGGTTYNAGPLETIGGTGTMTATGAYTPGEVGRATAGREMLAGAQSMGGGGTLGGYYNAAKPYLKYGIPVAKGLLGYYQNMQTQKALEDELERRKRLEELQMLAYTDPMKVPGLAQQARYANQLYSNQYRATHGGSQGGAYGKGLARYVNDVVQRGAMDYANSMNAPINSTQAAYLTNLQAGGTRKGAMALGATDALNGTFDMWLRSI